MEELRATQASELNSRQFVQGVSPLSERKLSRCNRGQGKGEPPWLLSGGVCKSSQFLSALFLAFEAQSLRSASQWRRPHALGMRRHPLVASESQNMMPGASCLGFGVLGTGDRDKGQQVSMDLKSKQCPVEEFSTGYSCCLLPTFPALYYPKETSS